jgi:hypothetical protein
VHESVSLSLNFVELPLPVVAALYRAREIRAASEGSGITAG